MWSGGSKKTKLTLKKHHFIKNSIINLTMRQRCVWVPFSLYLMVCLELLCSFKSWKVKHLKRVYNIAAHDLAQAAKASGISQLWRGSEPPIIQRVLLVDRAKC